MMLHKFLHPANCDQVVLTPKTPSASKDLSLSEYQDFDTTLHGQSCCATNHSPYLLSLVWQGNHFGKNHVQNSLDLSASLPAQAPSIHFGPENGLNISLNGKQLLSSLPQLSFGVSGKQFLYQFQLHTPAQFYGMGEKLFGLERSGKRTKFWNTDVFADFHWTHHLDHEPDPLYVSIPYLIIATELGYIGLLVQNPECVFMDTGSATSIEGFKEVDHDSVPIIKIGTESGPPDLVVFTASTLQELTRQYQQAVGKTPLPPVWSLGYQQCRWGYKDENDLCELANKMQEHEIPCDGLWIDIDYMKGYRVFTFRDDYFPKLTKTLSELKKQNLRVVPILDPGVKVDPGYSIYREGIEQDHFCYNHQSKPYVGLVWPGETVFPDYSLEDARKWWAKHVAEFTTFGFSAYWIDMNDPSTGSVEYDSMLFNKGTESHATYHNQYANGMAQATREGLLAANPNERPFILSRSASTGMAKHSAVWTGDNHSNENYLKRSIACSINLALSGIPFNGPDVAGFGCDCTPDLMQRWMKMGFLFPFFRNHSAAGTARQEPWAFDQETLGITRHYLRMRYYLRPYLYQLYIQQAERGEALLRPLFYEDSHPLGQPESFCDDQFMMGRSLMQAPILEKENDSRKLILPNGQWFDFIRNQYVDGGQIITATVESKRETPVYAKAGSIIPTAITSEIKHSNWEPLDVEFHLFLTQENSEACYVYHADDGISFDYEKGKRTTVEMVAGFKGETIHVTMNERATGFGQLRSQFVLWVNGIELKVNGQEVELKEETRSLFGKEHRVMIGRY